MHNKLKMTVGELKEKLSKYRDDQWVVFGSTSEGIYMPVSGVQETTNPFILENGSFVELVEEN